MDKIMRYYKAFYIFLILLSIPDVLMSQDYPLAPEVWSEPMKIDTFAQKYQLEYSASFTPNLDTVYLFINNGIYTSRKVNGIWQTPERLNDNVNSGIIRNPSISKDGKRIYYSAWGGYGNWDLWYNDWDDSLNDWGPAKKMESEINYPGINSYLYEVCKDTIYTIHTLIIVDGPCKLQYNDWSDSLNDLGLSKNIVSLMNSHDNKWYLNEALKDSIYTINWESDVPCLYTWDEERNEWYLIDDFSDHPLGAGGFNGLSITKNYRKLYFSQSLSIWKDYKKKNYELCVSYWDSSKNNWGDIYFLNINSEAYRPDTSNQSYWIGGSDCFPWISQDGKTLIFSSNRNASKTDTIDNFYIYISHLLVDENGNTVGINEHTQGTSSIKEFQLFPNYPNPFNSTTTISFNLPRKEVIHLSIYNLLGEEVAQLIGGEVYEKGKHIIHWNVKNSCVSDLSSGVYLCRLKGRNFYQTVKMLYLK